MRKNLKLADTCEECMYRNEFFKMQNELRTIERKLVRCKDCKWYKDFDGCFFSTAECEPEHFCSWGERREE